MTYLLWLDSQATACGSSFIEGSHYTRSFIKERYRALTLQQREAFWRLVNA